MERLLRDAEAYRASMGETVDYEITNLADVYTAIGDIQKKLGIAGTTAKEASTTISGSAATMKAAWQNVLTAISGGGDLDKSIENLVDSVEVYFKNIVPVVEKALIGIGSVIEKVSPMLVQTVANAFIRSLPKLVSAVWQMIQGLFQGIKLALIELLSGKPNEIVEKQAQSADKAAKNQNKITKNIKETNAELKKSLAGFDEIQILSSNSAEEEMATPYDAGVNSESLPSVSFDGTPIVEAVSKTFVEIAEKVSGWLMALGCILLVTGNIAWGVGLIIAGAIGSEYAEAQIGDGSSLKELLDTITNVLIIAGVVAIILGILLCMAQMWGLGIKLIAIGAVAVGGSVAVNWDSIKEKLQGSLGGWLVVGGIVAIILGILLCFTPMLPLGIGLIVLGAAAVVAPIVANWDAIWNTITTTFAKVTNWIETHGLAMLVLGCILCSTGVALPIGLALIAFGIKGMVQGKDPTTNAIVDVVKRAWEAVKAFWNKYIAPIFTAKFWLDLAKKCGNGLISGFEAAINGIIGMFEKMINWIVDGLNKISFDVPDWVPGIGGKKLGFNIPEVKFGRVSIPRLAQGAVIPPNREFLAVLGDNKRENEIVSPVSAMKQAFTEAMIEMGGSGQTTKEEHYFLNETELMRIVYRLAKGGEKYTGGSLIANGV